MSNFILSPFIQIGSFHCSTWAVLSAAACLQEQNMTTQVQELRHTSYKLTSFRDKDLRVNRRSKEPITWHLESQEHQEVLRKLIENYSCSSTIC